MTLTSNRKKLLDDKETFLLWVELGTLKKVTLHYKAQGLINPKTMKPFTLMAVWTSSMRWVLNNPEEARGFYEKDLGEAFSDDEWEEFLLKKVFQVYNYSKSRTIRWAKNHGLFDKHYHVFAEKFSLPKRE